MICFNKNILILNIFIILFNSSLIYSQSSNSTSTQFISNKDYAKCSCDLTEKHCDLNCCCDSFCQLADLEAFTCYSTPNQNQLISSFTTKQWCVQSNAIFFQNTPYIINTFGDLVCVDLNNSLSMNYYQTPLLDQIVLKEEYISKLVNVINPINSQSLNSIYSLQIPQTNDSFKNNDYVWRIYSNNNIDYLTIPIQVGTKCRDGPPINYFKNKESKCLIYSNDIQNECLTTDAKTSLSFGYFYSLFKIIQKPNSLKSCLNSQTQVTDPFDYYTKCDDKYLTNLKIRSCKLDDGTQITEQECTSTYLKPTLVNDVCSNLVKSITLILRFKNPTGIIETGIDVIFFKYTSLQTNTLQIEQKFKIIFIPDTITLSTFDTIFAQKLSGNPGYLKGQPIQAGISSNTADRNKRLSYLRPNSQGNCPKDDSIRGSVNFKENLFTECIYKPEIDPNLSNYCTLVQNEILNILLGYAIDNRVDRYAPFANSESSLWAAIVNNVPPSDQVVSNINGVCKSLKVGLSIQIAYALVGSLANPQAQLQYVSYNWNEATDINLKCSGQFCAYLNNLKLKITTRVTFVDVSQPPLYTESKIQRPQTNLPGDFFYPLSSSGSKVIIHYRIEIILSFVSFLINKFLF